MGAIDEGGLAQAPLLLKSAAAIQRQRPRVAGFDADPDAMYAPTGEAGVEEGVQRVRAEPLAPAIGGDEQRELHGARLGPLAAQDGQSDRRALNRLDDECRGPTQNWLFQKPPFDLLGHVLE